MNRKQKYELDYFSMIVPLLIVASLCVWFVTCPEQSTYCINLIRGVLGNHLGWFYMLLGLGTFLATIYLAFSRYGQIRLGASSQREYTNFQWGTMIFTSTMAADILYYSCIEWALYGNESRMEAFGGMQAGASMYPLFHWGPIPWSFYLVLAAAFGFMIHVRGRNQQKFSEALRPLLKDKVDGPVGTVVNLIAVFALLAGTATTFSLATPLLSGALCDVFGLTASSGLTILILILIAVIYTVAVLTGFRGIMWVAKACTFLFLGLAVFVFLGGGESRYILETGITAIGNLIHNFIPMATFMDPLRATGDGVTGFVQDWTIFYWAYWLVWCVATPFFIGVISKGRTLKSVILGGYTAGLMGTFTSFTIFGNYGLAQQMKGHLDVIGLLEEGASIPSVVIEIFHTLPFSKGALLLLVLVMIALYSTTFDTLTMVISMYSYRHLQPGQEPGKKVRAFWAVLFIIFPIGLLIYEKPLESLQAVSIIAALPVGVIVILIIISFVKDLKAFVQEEGKKDSKTDVYQ